MSAAMIYTLPPLIFFLLIQKRIVAGLASGSVKG
jgi:ABC-type glycerol-3-phosphate transport system permease component